MKCNANLPNLHYGDDIVESNICFENVQAKEDVVKLERKTSLNTFRIFSSNMECFNCLFYAIHISVKGRRFKKYKLTLKTFL